MSYWDPYDDYERTTKPIKPIRITASSYSEDSLVFERRNVSQAYKKRKTKKRRCQCGDPLKIRELIENFAKHSTMHGAVYLAPGRGKIYLCFWRTLLVLCILGVTLSVVSITLDALGSQSISISTNRKKIAVGRNMYDNFPTYPGITICPMPAYEVGDENATKLFEYASISLGFPFSSLTVQETSMLFLPNIYPDAYEKFKKKTSAAKNLYDEYVKKTSGFSLKRFLFENRVKCESMFIDCIGEMVGLNCCEIFKPILTTLGTCYSLKPDQIFTYVRELSEELEGFNFYIDLLSPPATGSNKLLGFSAVITDPFIKPIYIDYKTGIMVSPGLVATISLHLSLTNREEFYDTWYGLGAECPKLPEEFQEDESQRERYSRTFCLSKQITAHMKRDCNCMLVLDYEEDQLENRVCEPEDVIQCFAASFMKQNATGMGKVCQPPCIEYTYNEQVTYAALDTENGSASRCRLVIHYSSDDYLYNEYKRYTLSTFFSQIGGSMGLLLGASVITSIEFVAFVVKLIWYRFIPLRRRNRIRNKRQVK